MRTLDPKNVSKALTSLEQRIDQWRHSPSKAQKMPEGLWQEAAELARECGVNYTSKSLGISYSVLRKKMESETGSPSSGKSIPSFVEIRGFSSTQENEPLEIEVRRSDGCCLFVRKGSGDDLSRAMDAFCCKVR